MPDAVRPFKKILVANRVKSPVAYSGRRTNWAFARLRFIHYENFAFTASKRMKRIK